MEWPLPYHQECSRSRHPTGLSSLWDSLKLSIEQVGLKLAATDDHMVWSIPSSTATVKDIYLDLIHKKILPARKIFPLIWWKLTCPLKVIIFSWLVFYNKNLTWENLRKRSWQGPSRCVLCNMEEETNFHMFVSCRTSNLIWYELPMIYSFQRPNFSSVDAAFQWWGRQHLLKRPILPITIWSIWKWRNLKIFENSNISSNYVLTSVLAPHPSIA